MRNLRLRYILFFWVILFCQSTGWAAPLPPADTTDTYRLRVPSEDFIRRFREDADFDYSIQQEPATNWWQELKLWLRRYLFRTPSKSVEAWLDVAMNIIVVAFLLFVIYKLTRYYYMQERKKKVRLPGQTDDAVADRLVNDDSLLTLLGRAIAAADFERAVRIQYWYTLYAMDRKGWVHWDEHKTNLCYIHELQAGQRREDFTRLTRVFDYVCYGEFRVSADLYKQLEQEFKHFRQELEK